MLVSHQNDEEEKIHHDQQTLKDSETQMTASVM